MVMRAHREVELQKKGRNSFEKNCSCKAKLTTKTVKLDVLFVGRTVTWFRTWLLHYDLFTTKKTTMIFNATKAYFFHRSLGNRRQISGKKKRQKKKKAMKIPKKTLKNREILSFYQTGWFFAFDHHSRNAFTKINF